MKVVLNGEHRDITSNCIFSLLAELDLGGKKVAVEQNKIIVPRETYEEAFIKEGDSIEIVHFIGGG